MEIVKLIFLFWTVSFFVHPAIAQKVENKKGITYVDGKPLLKFEGGSFMMDNQPAKISNVQSGKLLFVITKHFYDYKGDRGYWYNEIRFSDFELSFKSSYEYRALIKSLFENAVFAASGDLNREALEKYIRLYSFKPLNEN